MDAANPESDTPVTFGKNVAVIGGGNTDFGSKFCIAAKVISHFFKTRLLYQFEISGTPTDVLNVQEIIQKQIRIENESNS
jgi:protein involved in ribonucleotide reduction